MAKGTQRIKTLAEQIADLDDPAPRDFDPEDLHDLGRPDDGEESDSGVDANQGDAREHYQSVGKSKIRHADEIPLGKQYDGLSVSRDDLDVEESDDDPFGKSASETNGSSDDDSDAADDEHFDDPDQVEIDGGGMIEDEDIDSDEAFGESDDELRRRFKFLGSDGYKTGNGEDISDHLEGNEESEEDSGASVNSSDTDTDMADGPVSDEDEASEEEDESAESEEDQASIPGDVKPGNNDRAALRKLMASDQKAVAATLSEAAKADATKGRAVKRQRSTFGALLNTRMKLQKGLVAMNALSTEDSTPEDSIGVIEAAEKAALALWSTLEDLREDLSTAQTPEHTKTSQKRKRPATSASSEELWKHMRSSEDVFAPQRRSVLDKWSAKVRAAAVPDVRGKLIPRSQQQGIVAVLDTQLTTESDKLIQRTKILRSAPQVQVQSRDQKFTASLNSGSIFDDTDFYQLLLRELVEQRMDLSSQAAPLQIATSLRATKVKNKVDTKASKGRKMRYTVHEKLQNFMAPEDRGTWTERARDEFFGSLLGARVDRALAEEEDEEQESEGEADALRLFRT